MRAEKRKKYIILILAVVLALTVPVTYLRVLLASGHIRGGDQGPILDRYGGTLYDDGCEAPELLGNLTGGNHLIANSLSVRYNKERTPSGFSPLVGFESLEGKEGDRLTTTLLPISDQRKLAELFGDYNGCCFAYDYVTGQVYTMLSLPSSLSRDAVDSSYINRCLSARYIPGSTMKIIAAICALEQDPALAEFTYTCTGAEELPDGNSVTCGSAHRKVTFETAIGRSCNCYMAALIRQFDVAQTQEILERLGVSQTGDEQRESLDKLSRITSRTRFSSTRSFNDIWSLIGQGYSEMSVIDMAMIAGAVANHGWTANPYVVQSIAGDEDVTYQADTQRASIAITPDIAEQMSKTWKNAVNRYYRSGKNLVSDEITCAKTGTAQQGDGTTDRMLLGVMEEKHVAFMIVVEGLPSGNPLPCTIANTLCQLIPDSE